MKLSLCITCYVAFLFLYSIVIIAIEATSFKVGLTFAILPFLLFILLNWLAIPKPSEAVVHAIFGENLWQIEKGRPSLITDSDIVSYDDDDDDNGFAIRTIAHRGCGLDAPENSIAAFELCKKNGCKCIETDVFLTADKVAVIFHDDTLDRMTDGVGLIANNTFQELQRLNLVFRHRTDAKHNFVDVRIPTLEQCITFCLNSNMKLILDVKDGSDEMVSTIVGSFKRHPQLHKMAMVSSFNALFLYKIRSADPQIVCSMAWRPEYYSCTSYDPVHGGRKCSHAVHRQTMSFVMDAALEWLFNNIIHHLVGLSAVLLHKDSLSGRTVARWQNKGIRVMAWTVNTKIEKDYCANILHIPYLTDTMDYNH